MSLLERVRSIFARDNAPRTSAGQPLTAAAPKHLREPAFDEESLSWVTRKFIKGLTPSRILAIFENAYRYIDEQIQLAHELEESDDHLRGTLALRRAAVLRLDTTVEPGDPDDPRCVEAAELAREITEQPWFYQASEDLLRACWTQWSAVEVLFGPSPVWKRNKLARERWMPSGYRAVEPQRWSFDDRQRPQFYKSLTGRGETVEPVAGHFILHGQGRTSTPGDFAIVRCAALLIYFAKLDLKQWGTQIDQWGVPVIKMTYADGLSTSQVQTIVTEMLALAGRRVIATPQGTTVETEEVPDQLPHETAQNFCRRALSRLLIGQDSSQMAIEGQRTGATLQGEVRDDIRDADALLLDASQNETFFAPWCAWNFGPDVAPPRIKRTRKDTPDPEARGRVFKIAAELGLAVKRDQVYGDLGIEEPAEGDETLTAVGPFAATDGNNGPPGANGGPLASAAQPASATTPGARAEPLTGIQITSAMEVLARLRQATLEPVPAEELLVALGFERELSVKMVKATPRGKDDSEADRTFKREVVKAFLADGTSNDVLYNAIEITKLIEEVNLPTEPGYKPPWLPIVAQPGEEITGEVVKDAEGDIVGGDAEEPPAPNTPSDSRTPGPGRTGSRPDPEKEAEGEPSRPRTSEASVAARQAEIDELKHAVLAMRPALVATRAQLEERDRRLATVLNRLQSAVAALSVKGEAVALLGEMFSKHTPKVRALAESILSGDYADDKARFEALAKRLPELFDMFDPRPRADLIAKAQMSSLGNGMTEMADKAAEAGHD